MTGTAQDQGAAPARVLAGVRVIEQPGPATAYLGRLLADNGADVRLVALPGMGAPPHEGVAEAAYREVFSVGKGAIAPADVAAALPTTDILLCADTRWLADAPTIAALRAAHPRLIVVTVTPFGADGPYANRPSSDLVTIALGGYLNMTGPSEGQPLKPTAPYLSYRHAGNHAFVGVLLALRRRRQTGAGTHVDAAARDTGLWMLTHTYQFWDLERINLARRGSGRDVGGTSRSIPLLYRCRDGLIVWMALSGRLAMGSVDKLVELMDREGLAPDWLKGLDWETLEIPLGDEADRFVAPFAAFFATKTKQELFDAAVQYGFMIAPVSQMEETLANPQLAARDGWLPYERDGQTLRLPRRPVHLSAAAWEPRLPA